MTVRVRNAWCWTGVVGVGCIGVMGVVGVCEGVDAVSIEEEFGVN